MEFLHTTSLLNGPLNALALWSIIITTCIATLALIPPMRLLAIKFGYVDQPGGRKIHTAPTPPIGGFVIFTLFLLIHSVLFAFTPQVISLYTALILLLITGLIDDKKPVRASVKFLIHFAAAAIIVLGGGAELENMGNMLGLGEWHLGWFAPIFSMACIVYLINAINMMDGIDGLAGGKSLVVLGWLMLAALLHGQYEALLHIGILAATLSGFLFYNMRHPLRDKACIFLGDTGSMALGLIIGWFCIHMAQGENAPFQPISIAWIIALPIIDAFGLFAMRIYEGRHPFSPDLRHFHHHFIHAGFPVGQSTFMILSLAITLGAIGFCASILNWPEPLMTAIWVCLWVGHAILVIKSDHFVHFLQKTFHLKHRNQP
jgi:UDP-GlcNAc:undecaprenyl-phosphate GlcNAc-1-phosphate transferase|tara:strand:+ start:269458 stop:270579 length:1122 start_codon:yes stop_codon:yes gene_type:complete